MINSKDPDLDSDPDPYTDTGYKNAAVAHENNHVFEAKMIPHYYLRIPLKYPFKKFVKFSVRYILMCVNETKLTLQASQEIARECLWRMFQSNTLLDPEDCR